MLVLVGEVLATMTHEMSFARELSDRVLFMDQGRIVEAATPEKLFTAPDHPRIKAFLQKML